MSFKSALITGITGNLGSAVAKRFMEGDYKVFGMARKNNGLDFPAAKFRFVPCDLTDEKAGREGVESVIKDAGRIDIAVLTAGGFAPGSMDDMDTNSLHQMIKINFETAVNAAKPVFTHMLKKGTGRLFLTGARTGLQMQYAKGATAYGFSKSLIFRLAELLNAEAKGTDVVVSVIVPSTIDTPQNREAMPGADFSSWVTPESIAETIYYYSSANASHLREPVIKVYNKA